MSVQCPLPGEMIQLTLWEHPKTFIRSMHGTISWGRYLQLEKERIEKSPGRVVEIRHGTAQAGDKYALFVNYVGAPVIDGNYRIEANES